MTSQKSFPHHRFLLLTCLWLALAVPGAAAGQVKTQDTNPIPLTFEVVSIRRNLAEMGPATAKFDYPANGDGLNLADILLSSIVGSFYDHNQDTQSGMPAWANAECFDIRAKVAESDLAAYHALTKAQRKRMVQAMLEEKFKLQTHLGQKEAPIYELTVAKGGSKLKPAASGAIYTSGPKGADGQFQSGTIFISGPGEETAHAAPMRMLAGSLSQIAGRQVIDKTGLTATYDFTFKWAPDRDSADGPSIFTALEEQLGLKLEPAKGMVETLVIDHIEHPVEN